MPVRTPTSMKILGNEFIRMTSIYASVLCWKPQLVVPQSAQLWPLLSHVQVLLQATRTPHAAIFSGPY